MAVSDRQRRTRADRRSLSHLDRTGRPRMVDVSEKPATARRAIAEAELRVSQETLSLVIDGGGPKGDVFTVAELAGVLAAKRTSELIPLAHPLPLTDVEVEIRPDRAASSFRIRASAATVAPTGVEMEALVAAAIAALTVYDMIKGVERGAELSGLRLVEKSGGRSGEWHRPDDAAPAAPRPRAARAAGRASPRPFPQASRPPGSRCPVPRRRGPER
jgi:cyclic pyranopterin phosphate synthase